MEKKSLKRLIDVAAGRVPADIVIKNCKIVDVCGDAIIDGSIAICGEEIAGIGDYEGEVEYDGQGRYALPGLIDAHIHVESSCVSPEELGRMVVPLGTTTIVADPHEIVNVCGTKGLDYMIDGSRHTALSIKYMLPSCVPATPFEHAGAIIDAKAMEEPIENKHILGLGEYMNFPGVINDTDADLDKILVAKEAGKLVDGHVPSITGKALNAYCAARIRADHECSTLEEMRDRLARGMYILMRQGSACHNLETLVKGITPANSHRCCFCSDDRQVKTIFEEGHLDNHLRICVQNGIDPIIAVQMATINAAECFHMEDRGILAPGYNADVVLVDDLKDFHVQQVFIRGKEVARDGEYLLPSTHADISYVRGSFHVKDFSVDKLKVPLTSNHVYVIDVLPGGVVTGKGEATIELDEDGDFVFNPEQDIAKIAVVERHKNTGNVARALLRGYGIKKGAVAVSIAHDSHNIIAVGVSNEEIAHAVETVIAQEGGVALVCDGEVLEQMPMPIAGIMSDQSGEWVNNRLSVIHEVAYEKLGVNHDVDPVMTLCFMSLPVIPHLKITDMGLFDVDEYKFIKIEVPESGE